AQINFSLETAGQLNIEVYNLSGQMVDQIASEQFSKGNHSINWTPAQNLPAGMYIIRMNTQNQYYNSKVLLNR
ncbi:MAG: T9SS type A sorting domain-containing protein, partial [Bacteroidales bacterium]|nr:T9SS type A sorting domain-containing protein [Bacteroidales bacterium]